MSKYFKQAQQFLRYGHVLVWMLLLVCISMSLVFIQGWQQAGIFFSLSAILGTAIVVLVSHRVFPALMEFGGKKKKDMFIPLIMAVLLFFLGIVIQLVLIDWLDIHLKPVPIPLRIAVWFSLIAMGIILMVSFKLNEYYYHNKLSEATITANKAITELSVLKNQINPHFLFNTLNNIYGLAYMGDKKSAEMISKLSQIMRYLLYDCDRDKVKLTNERDLILNYLQLQGLKQDEELNVDFYQEGIKSGALIPPMILINFVENCFKHSDLETNDNGWIKISMELEDDKLYFTTANTTKAQTEKILFERQGIGLKNSQKLLEGYYPGSHTLEMKRDENVFEVNLSITL